MLVKKNDSVLLLLIFIFLAPLNCEESKEMECEKCADEIIYSYVQKAEKELNIICTGDGGRITEKIDLIKIMFSANRKGSIDEARKLEVELTEKLIQEVNSKEKARIFLNEYPFKPDRAKISLSFRNRRGSYYTDGSIAYVLHSRDNLYYFSYDKKSKDLVLMHEESYESALQKISKQK